MSDRTHVEPNGRRNVYAMFFKRNEAWHETKGENVTIFLLALTYMIL